MTRRFFSLLNLSALAPWSWSPRPATGPRVVKSPPAGVRVIDHDEDEESRPSSLDWTPSYRVVNDQARLDAVHSGKGLRLETVIASVLDEYHHDWGGPPFDLTVYHHDRVAAVLRFLGYAKGFRVLSVSDPLAEAERREQDDYTETYRPALDNQRDLEEARHERLSGRPLPWQVTEGDNNLYDCHPRLTLDEVIAEEVDGWDGGWDRAVWRGQKLIAVIRTGEDGGPEVVRMGGMSPA